MEEQEFDFDRMFLEFEGTDEEDQNRQSLFLKLRTYYSLSMRDAIDLAFNMGMLYIDKEHPEIAPDKEMVDVISAHVEELKSLGSFSKEEGYVYFLKAEGHNIFKVGITKTTPYQRIPTIQSGCPYELSVFAYVYYSDCREKERWYHLCLEPYRMYGEWFEVESEIIEELIAQEYVRSAISKNNGNSIMQGRLSGRTAARRDEILGSLPPIPHYRVVEDGEDGRLIYS